ncbi:PilZ domain-containing protein [Sphingomonas sp. MMS12-HWE2-04]|uniref:PilZ domain-containing protein n=1 Tax=Sphingomonas sp. MMS12-HWE2-04 TaxID=3234199 RepID=UPI00384CC303
MATKFSQYRKVAPALVEQRSAPRHPILVSRASVRKQGDTPAEATLRDLSVYGCRLACATGHDQGERLWLRLHGSLPIAATVVWNDGGHIGCRFDAPIERSLMRALTLVIC